MKTVTLRLEDELVKKLDELAKLQRRSRSNMIASILDQWNQHKAFSLGFNEMFETNPETVSKPFYRGKDE